MQKRDYRLVVASGYFNPLHVGHIEYLEKARALGDRLVVIINSDYQVFLKKGEESFMHEQERITIVKALRCVDDVFLSIDKDLSVCKSLEQLHPDIFAKGGDRNVGNIPEREICERIGCEIIDGLGEKIQSSSSLLQKAKR